MLNFLMVSLTIFLIGGFHLYVLFKKKLVKEALTSVILFIVALVYAYGEVLYWSLPGPSEFISLSFQPLVELVFGVTLR